MDWAAGRLNLRSAYAIGNATFGLIATDGSAQAGFFPNYAAASHTASSLNVRLVVAAGVPWSLRNVPAWFSASPSSGTGPAGIVFSWTANSSSSGRTAYVSAGSALFTLGQSPTPSDVTLSATRLDIPAAAGSRDINITVAPTGGSWGTSSAQSWVWTSPPSGNGSQTLRIG